MNKVVNTAGALILTVSLLTPTTVAVAQPIMPAMRPNETKIETISTFPSLSAMDMFSTKIGTSISSTQRAGNFKDVASSHWAYSAIQSAVRKGYVEGYTDGTFKPDRSVSRAEFITMAVRALDIEAPAQDIVWYDGYLKAARQNGFYENQFKADQFNKAIPRQEMARLAVRASGIKLYNNTDFNDAGYMYLATLNGIVNGMGAGQVAPEGVTTRAQAIAVIERILSIKEGKKLTPADIVTRENAEFAWHNTNLYTIMGDKLEIDNPYQGLGSGPYKVQTSDGLFSGEMKRLIVVDLKDDAAIKRHNVDMENWFWNAADQDNFPIKRYRDSYLFIMESTAVTKDKNKHADRGYLPYSITTGSENRGTAQEFFNGNLDRSVSVLDRRYLGKDNPNIPTKLIPVKIIPKSSMGVFRLHLMSPTITGSKYDKIIMETIFK